MFLRTYHELLDVVVVVESFVVFALVVVSAIVAPVQGFVVVAPIAVSVVVASIAVDTEANHANIEAFQTDMNSASTQIKSMQVSSDLVSVTICAQF
jgi:hypothetical protein